jgi:hypothetical protein
VTVPNPTFSLEHLLQEAINREGSSENCDESEGENFDDDAENGERGLEAPQANETSSASLQLSTPPPMADASISAKDRRRARIKSQGHTNRRQQRQRVQDQSFSHHTPRSSTYNKYIATATPIVTPMSTASAPVANSAFVGLDDRMRSKRVYKLEEVVGKESLYNFTLQTWDGRYATPPPLFRMPNAPCRSPLPILTDKRRLIVLPAGHPEDSDWALVHQEAADALEEARRRCHVPEKKRLHRRGYFCALRCGVSHGGGQKLPGNLKNTVGNTRILKELNALSPFQRLAGFSTCGFLDPPSPRN